MNPTDSPSGAVDASAFVAATDAWHADRMARLREPDGWLTLVGLQWLQDGENVIESSEGPIGTIQFRDGDLSFQAAAGVEVSGVPQDGRLISDTVGTPTMLTAGTVSFFVIERAGRLAVRIKDSAAPWRTAFPTIERCPVDPTWNTTARFKPVPPTEVPMELIIGETEAMTAAGHAVWTHDGAEYELLLLESSAPRTFFLVFGDATNGDSTYGAGRFLAVTQAEDAETVELDFNRAYNPPCSLTPFATCPIPPESNRLPFPIEAGERAPATSS